VGRRALMPVLIGMSLAVLIGWRLLGASNVPAEARFAILQNPFQAYEVQRARNLPVIIEDLRYLPLGAGLGRTGAASAEFAADIRDKPLEGFESGFENSETFFAGELSETGIPGTLLILLITAVFLKRGWTVFHNTQDRELKATAGALLAMLIALAVSYFGGPTLYTPPFNTYFWFAGGLLARIALMDQELQQKPAAAAAA
ncbi:MAG TPA: hypothetical protein VFB90_08965, partial [Dehalococcoidia bacterium]|nr:hypothetical protein [Dehalococcoidia bacterium]